MILKERWKTLDWIFLGGISVVALVIRSIRLGTPKELVFDELYYVPDACRYILHLPELCATSEHTWMHPPLGKWMIAFGLQMLGPTPIGWRVMSVVAGVVTIALVYVIARCLFESRIGASVAAGLLTFDFLHFTHSRLGMLDIFTTLFVTIAVLCAVIDRDDTTRAGPLRPWRWGAGAALGAAVATKLSALLLWGAVVALTLLWDRRFGRGQAPSRGTRLTSTAIAFLLIPAGVYLFSFAGHIEGTVLAAPWTEGSWFMEWLHEQARILEYHTTTRITSTLPPHPAASPAWSWLLLKRPFAYWFLDSGGTYREILGMGHVLMWPLALPALAWLVTQASRARDAAAPATILAVLLLTAYVPWILLSAVGQDTFPFYLLPGLPFLYLGFGAIADRLRTGLGGRTVVVGTCLAAIAGWVFFMPLLTAAPVSVDSWNARIWFRSCRPAEAAEPERNERPELARARFDELVPTRTEAIGWCWI